MTHPPADLERRLEEILERYGRLLASTIRRVCPRDLGIDTADVEQEARIRLWRFLTRATDEAPNPSYVYRVAASAAIDAVRAAVARRDRASLDAPRAADDGEGGAAFEPAAPAAGTPEAETRRHEVVALVEAALLELGDARQRAVRLHLWGLSSPEISSLTGWSGGKVRTLISRGLAELRRRLAAKGVTEDA